MDSTVQFPLQLIAHFVFLFASNVIYSVLQVAISRGAAVNHSSPDAQKKKKKKVRRKRGEGCEQERNDMLKKKAASLSCMLETKV